MLKPQFKSLQRKIAIHSDGFPPFAIQIPTLMKNVHRKQSWSEDSHTWTFPVEPSSWCRAGIIGADTQFQSWLFKACQYRHKIQETLQLKNWCLCRWNSFVVIVWVKWQQTSPDHCQRDDIFWTIFHPSLSSYVQSNMSFFPVSGEALCTSLCCLFKISSSYPLPFFWFCPTSNHICCQSLCFCLCKTWREGQKYEKKKRCCSYTQLYQMHLAGSGLGPVFAFRSLHSL